jgi:DNA-binding XRE family transcriptional regulator
MMAWRMVGHPSRFLEGGYPRNPIITIPIPIYRGGDGDDVEEGDGGFNRRIGAPWRPSGTTGEVRIRTLQRYGGRDVPKLKGLREEAVLSQRELARMSNLAYRTVWGIKNGFSEVHPSTIRKLARVLGVESKELVKRGG